MRDLSVLIPARNEIFLAKTIESVLAAAELDTEVIAVLDGYWPEPEIEDHPRVTLIHVTEPLGQRAATNAAARLSTARFVMKADAHMAFDQGFDKKLIEAYDSGELGADVTTVPRMYNLHAFDWQCPGCGERVYQGPRPAKCGKCGSKGEQEMVVVWQPRWGRKTEAWRFDRDLHFQYWAAAEKRPENRGEIADIMCCLGACFMMTRERYWELGGMDEAHGSWGQMGVEVGCKSWLSGGRMVVNKRTWYSHMFRTQDGFSFPYPNPGVDKARAHSRRLWLGNEYPKATRPFEWLIDKFKPVPGWHDEPAASQPSVGAASTPRSIKAKPRKGLVYYTDCRLDGRLAAAVQANLNRHLNGHDLVTVSLQPLAFGRNIHLPLERGHDAYFRQILAGLEEVKADVVFLAEHDILYHPSHFEFTPERADAYYYNRNQWKVDAATGRALFYLCDQVSGLCADRELLLEHYRKRVARMEAEGRFDRNIGFEPGSHKPPRGIDDHPALHWMSAKPNIDIRHGGNLTKSRWSRDEFRNKKTCLGWTEADAVPGWGRTRGRFDEFLKEVLP